MILQGERVSNRHSRRCRTVARGTTGWGPCRAAAAGLLLATTAVAGDDPVLWPPDVPPAASSSLDPFRWQPPSPPRTVEVRRVSPGLFAYRGELIDAHAVRDHLRAHPEVAAARFDRRARALEIATWSLLGVSGAGFVVAGAMYPPTEGATLVDVFPAAAVPALAALVTGLEALRLRRLAVDTFVRDDLGVAGGLPPVLPTVRVVDGGAAVGVTGVF